MAQRKLAMGITTILVIVSTFLIGCQSFVASSSDSSSARLIVAVTIPPQKAFVKAVCDDLADIVTVVPPGNSPGNYEPSPAEIARLSKAAVYFTIGVPTEEANILPRIQNQKITDLSLPVAAKYPDRQFSDGARDPHIWLSPKRVIVMIEIIAQEMCTLDPANQERYQLNAQTYIQELAALDDQMKASLTSLLGRHFIVFHPSFGYLAQDYGMKMHALELDGKEATPQHLQELIDLAKSENIKVIFTQAEIDSRQSDAFAEEIGGVKIDLDPLSEDYLANMRDMAEVIAEAIP